MKFLSSTIFIFALAAAGVCIAAPSEPLVTSPDGKIAVQFSLSDQGVPTYSVSYKGEALILNSRLGLELKGKTSLDQGFSIAN